MAGIEVSLTVVGAAIGGILGGVVGIFNGDDCDCGPPLGISVVNPGTTNCGPTYQLYAWGAGNDAEFFDWTVTQGPSSASFPAQPALLGPPQTQASPTVPLVVSVVALCPEAMGDPVAMAGNTLPSVTIDLFSIPANQPGEVMVTSNYSFSGTMNVTTGSTDYFSISSTAGMSNNTFSASVFPPHMGSVTQNGNVAVIHWQNSGGGTVTFTATNTCSGLQSSTSASFYVGQ